MPSNAFEGHLQPLLADAEDLVRGHQLLRGTELARQHRLGPLNRAVVIACVSAWEAYVEELVRESLGALRPAVPPLGVWPALNASVRGQLGRFNTPNTENVRMLLSDVIGLQSVHHAWHWRGCASARAVARLAAAMEYRHEVAHGVNPRPAIDYAYSSRLPEFFLRLARCTDGAVRAQLVEIHGIANPWPA